MSKARAFCFTINNPTDDESNDNLEFLGASLALALEQVTFIKRFCFQFERGEMGTLHIQGYCGFDTPSRYSRLRSVDPIFDRAACLASRGSPAANLAYCTKDEGRVCGPWVSGDFPEQGQRSELLAAQEIIQSGGSMKQLLDQVPTSFFKFHRGFEKAISLMSSDVPRSDTCEVIVFYGQPGTGKSFMAEKILKHIGKPYYEVPAPQNGTLWLEGYAGEEYLFFDECYFNISLHMLLQLLDRKPIPIKGAMAYPKAVKGIFITTMKDIFTKIYPNVSELELKGFHRRVTAAYEFTGQYPATRITCRKFTPWSYDVWFDNNIPVEAIASTMATAPPEPAEHSPFVWQELSDQYIPREEMEFISDQWEGHW